MLKYMGSGQQNEINNKNKINNKAYTDRTYNFFITRNENEKILPDIKKSLEKKSKIYELSKTQQIVESEKDINNIITEEQLNEGALSKESRSRIKPKPKNEFVDKDINEILEDFKMNYPIQSKLRELYDKTNYYASKNNFSHSMSNDKDVNLSTKNLRANSFVNLNKRATDFDSNISRNIFYNTIKNQQIFKKKNVIRQNVFNNLVSKKDSFVSKSTTYKTTKKLNPIIISDYKNFIKKIKIKNPMVNKNLEYLNFYGPYFSYCPPCYNKNIEYYNQLEVNQCLGLLHHIKKYKTKDNKKSESDNKFDHKFISSKETMISTIN